ncbi:MAG: hypothetical protein Roseis2KO_40780 [Roseivirga sp.]
MNTGKLNEAINRWIVPFSITVLVFLATSSLYNMTISLDDLVRIDGEVRQIRSEKEKNSRGSAYNIFYIYLTSGAKLKIMGDRLFEPYRNAIKKTVLPGDSITIYIRTRQQTILGMGTTNLIYQVEHKGQVLMPLKVMHRHFKGLLIVMLVILAGLLTLQVLLIRKRRKNAKYTKW